MSLSCLIATHREHHLIDIPKSLQSEDGEKSQKSTMQGLEIDLVEKNVEFDSLISEIFGGRKKIPP